MLNRDSEVPLYLQLKDHIKRQIDSGVIKPGVRVPSEAECCAEYQISGVTVRKAYGELVDEGYLVRKKGKGTFVREIRYKEYMQAVSFTVLCEQNGLIPSSKVVEAVLMPADERLARELDIEPGAKIAHVFRVRYVNGIPVRLEHNYYSKPYLDIINEDQTGSVNVILRDKYKVTNAHKSAIRVEIVYVDAEESRMLGVKRNSAALRVGCALCQEDGKPIYFSDMLHVPERCVLYL